MCISYIESCHAQYLYISHTTVIEGSGIADRAVDESCPRVGIRILAYNIAEKCSLFRIFYQIHEIEFWESTRECCGTISEILVIFIIEDTSISIFISAITINITIIVHKLESVLPISLRSSCIVCCHSSRSVGWLVEVTETSTSSHTNPTTRTIIESSPICGTSDRSTRPIVSHTSCTTICSAYCSHSDCPREDSISVSLSVPVFFVVDGSSLFDIACELLTKIIEFLEKLYSIFCSDAGYREIFYREKYRCHDDGKYRHREYDFNEGKSEFIFYHRR